MAPKLYMIEISPPVRSVLMVAEALGLELERKQMDVTKGEHLTPEFIKINPQHTIPTLEDNGLIIWESNAIAAYLVSVYGKNDSLYPKDPRKRATVDQRLYFISSNLFTSMRRAVAPIIFKGVKALSDELQGELTDCYSFMEAFLDGKEWLAGDQLTIADLSAIAIMSSANIFLTVDSTKFPRVISWMKKCQALPYYEKANGIGLGKMTTVIQAKIRENNAV